jgi:chromosome segregation ATPase
MKLEEALLLANRPWVETALACGDAQEALDVLADEVVQLQEELTAADNEWKKHKRWVDQVSARAEEAEAEIERLNKEYSSGYARELLEQIDLLRDQLTKAMRVVEAGRPLYNAVGELQDMLFEEWSQLDDAYLEFDALRDFYKETE